MTFLPSAVAVTAETTPQVVVETFLALMAAGDTDGLAALMADDIVYINVGLPALRGRDRALKVLRGLDRPSFSFEVYLHSIATNGQTVLTERTDVLQVGKVRSQFWVMGRFDVRDGKIALWRDAFDYVDITRSLGRGLLGAVVPRLRPEAPVSSAATPGRSRS